MSALGLPPIVIDHQALTTSLEREPFDALGYELIARGGLLCARLVTAVERAADASEGRSLDLDQAVVGGLLVRLAKLTRGCFDSTQAENSETHSILVRCVAETAITLRWLVEHGTPESRRRFRADSFAYFGNWLTKAAGATEDDAMRATRTRLERHVNRELDIAGLTWADVPDRANSWGPNVRQRCADLDQAWLYDALFASHNNYIHGSWHELRAFHLRESDGGMRLAYDYAGISPIASYVTARVVAEAVGSAATALPHDLPADQVVRAVSNTREASQVLSSHFTEFIARGGIDDGLHL